MEDRAHVGGRVAAVGSPDGVGDDGVGVKVGIARAAHLVDVGGAHKTMRGDDARAPGAAAGLQLVGLEVGEAGRDAGGLGLEHRLTGPLVADRQQQPDRLGGGEGEVKAGVAAPLAQAGKALAGGGVDAAEERLELAVLGRSAEAQVLGLGADPLRGGVAALGVVVVAGELGALVVLAAFRGPDGEHPKRR